MLLPSVFIVALAISSPSGYRQQYPLPSTAVPSGWGVNIHFTDPAPGEMEQIALAGFKWVRMDFYWNQIEKKKGVYDFSAYDRLMSALKKQKMRPVFILDYGNDLYQQGSPREPQSIQGFCNFVSAAVTHFKGQGVLWEMWNEPNIFFWQPKPDVKQYIALALEVGKTIRKVAPEEWYVGPATSGIDFTFLDACFKAGLLKYWDAVTVHPYRTANPETVAGEWAKLRLLVDQYEPSKKIPLMSGEWGYSEKYSGLDLTKQSQYIARQYLTNLSCGVGLSIWYDWKDDGTDPKEAEHHFGTVYNDLKPKPTYESVKAITKGLSGYAYAARLSQSDPADWNLVFRRRNEIKAVGWSVSSESKSPFKLTAQPRFLSLSKPQQDAAKRSAELPELPQSIAVRTQADLRQAIYPLFHALRTGETLSISDVGEAGSEAIANVHQGNEKSLSEALSKQPCMWDRVSPERKLTLKITKRGREPILKTSSAVCQAPVQVNILRIEKGIISLRVAAQNLPLRARLSLIAQDGQTELSHTNIDLKANDEKDIHLGRIDKGLDKPLSVRMTDTEGHEIGRTETVSIMPISVGEGEWVCGVEGDDKIKGAASATVDWVEGGYQELYQGLRVNYSFDQGWKYLALRNSKQIKTDLPGKPYKLSMFVKGDQSGCALKVRILDSTGQTHQIDGMIMDWQDRKFISFPLDRVAVSWGGKNDGKIHYPIRFDTVLLIDGLGRAVKGHIEASDFVLSYR